MIARLKGILAEKTKELVVLDVQGVGYGLTVPETVLQKLPELGATVTLQVYTHVREDQLSLFGFLTHLERDVFQILLSASGVGPKLANSILSGLEASQLLEAVAQGNKAMFMGIHGVGKKTVEKLLLEIREKCEKRLLEERGASGTTGAHGKREASSKFNVSIPWAADLEQALLSLGYRENDVRMVMREIPGPGFASDEFELALKHALKLLNGDAGRTLRGTA